MSNFPTLQDLVLAAHERLTREVWEYLTYGTETETTVRRNRLALDRLAFLPRILCDVSEIDPATEFLGARLRIPVMLAPMGSIARFDPEGALAAGRAAEQFGTVLILSSHAEAEIRPLLSRAPLPLIYGLHPSADNAALDDEVDRVKAQGYRAISFATQSGYYSRRERDLMNHVLGKGQPTRSYSSYLEQQRQERAGGGTPSKEGLLTTMLTWDMLERVKLRSGLPIILKGVQTVADAELAVRHGVNVVYVSNNGGRAVDHARGTMAALPEIVSAVAGRAEVIVDGGFVHGSDVLKAIALGARAVCMGRMQGWALAAAGQSGVARMLEILEEEIVITMGLLGVNRLQQLDAGYLAAAEPCAAPHPLSAFPVVMERLGVCR